LLAEMIAIPYSIGPEPVTSDSQRRRLVVILASGRG
jgi:hypothetical protein